MMLGIKEPLCCLLQCEGLSETGSSERESEQQQRARSSTLTRCHKSSVSPQACCQAYCYNNKSVLCVCADGCGGGGSSIASKQQGPSERGQQQQQQPSRCWLLFALGHERAATMSAAASHCSHTICSLVAALGLCYLLPHPSVHYYIRLAQRPSDSGNVAKAHIILQLSCSARGRERKTLLPSRAVVHCRKHERLCLATERTKQIDEVNKVSSIRCARSN